VPPAKEVHHSELTHQWVRWALPTCCTPIRVALMGAAHPTRAARRMGGSTAAPTAHPSGAPQRTRRGGFFRPQNFFIPNPHRRLRLPARAAARREAALHPRVEALSNDGPHPRPDSTRDRRGPGRSLNGRRGIVARVPGRAAGRRRRRARAQRATPARARCARGRASHSGPDDRCPQLAGRSRIVIIVVIVVDDDHRRQRQRQTPHRPLGLRVRPRPRPERPDVRPVGRLDRLALPHDGPRPARPPRQDHAAPAPGADRRAIPGNHAGAAGVPQGGCTLHPHGDGPGRVGEQHDDARRHALRRGRPPRLRRDPPTRTRPRPHPPPPQRHALSEVHERREEEEDEDRPHRRRRRR